MNKITAQEARSLAGPSLENYLDTAYAAIRTAAENKKYSVTLTSSFWVNGGYNRSPDWIKACKQLEADGFKTHFFYEERQFVDMYTVVEW